MNDDTPTQTTDALNRLACLYMRGDGTMRLCHNTPSALCNQNSCALHGCMLARQILAEASA
jgi:hypothetical protein